MEYAIKFFKWSIFVPSNAEVLTQSAEESSLSRMPNSMRAHHGLKASRKRDTNDCWLYL